MSQQQWLMIILAGLGIFGSLAVGLIVTFVKHSLDRQTSAIARIDSQGTELMKADIRRVEEKFSSELRGMSKAQEAIASQVNSALESTKKNADRYDGILAKVIRMHKGFEERFDTAQKQWIETHVWVQQIKNRKP